MATAKAFKILIAETAPIILSGLVNFVKSLKEIHPAVIEVDSRDSLITTVSSEFIDLLVVNPSFGGLIHPSEVRKVALNTDMKIFAVEIGKLSKSTLPLYDDHFHVTDDLGELRQKFLKAVNVDEETEEKENLSSREKEIISFVVKGMTNQEIADKLFLSVHTVMTHRRNIARKLQIHSATGLTIYAIVNKIVDLSEIKL